MDKKDRKTLDQKALYLVKNLSVDELLLAASTRIFSEAMLDEIKVKNTGQARASKYIEMLKRRGPKAFEYFLAALRAADQGFIADELSSEDTQATAYAVGDVVEGAARGFPELPKPLPDSESDWLLREKPHDLPVIQPVKNPAELSSLIQNEIAYRLPLGQEAPRGRAICFNISHVEGNESRYGDEYDVEALQHVFNNPLLKFEFQKYSEYTADEIRETLKMEAARPELNDISIFFVFVMSHGKRDGFFGALGELVQLSEVEAAFDSINCPQLDKKPKALFVQACQVDLQTDAMPETSPGPEVLEAGKMHKQHILRSTCTYPGTSAGRHEAYGTFYIQALCYVISRYAHQLNLMQILEQAAELVNRHKYKLRQVLTITSTLNKSVYLAPGV